ncbi:hypothetical protein O5264_29650, partial [Escherichia coli]|nr:hypothetical protein [Escherichia coli]
MSGGGKKLAAICFAESQSRQPEAMDGEGGWLLPGL